MEEQPTAELRVVPMVESFEEVAAVERLSSEGQEKRLVRDNKNI